MLAIKYRVFQQTANGYLDFKQYISPNTLYLVNDTLYNRNEAGNFLWSYFMASRNYSWEFSNFGVQIVTFVGSLLKFNPRLDEPWDYTARRTGYDYYNYRSVFDDSFVSMNDY